MNALVLNLVMAVSLLGGAMYDPVSGSCTDLWGEPAWNPGIVGPCADFGGQDLTNHDFTGADLRGARFDSAALAGASFRRARLDGANFSGADLTKAVLTGAWLTGADFTDATMLQAHLEFTAPRGAVFTGADLRQVRLYGAELAGADLRFARFSRSRALLSDAEWQDAIVGPATLPFSREELAAMKLTVEEELAEQ